MRTFAVKLIGFLLLLSTLISVLFPNDVFATNITIIGPQGESQSNLPSTQANEDIWYKVLVEGLEPKTEYHLKIYLTKNKDDGTPYQTAIANGTFDEKKFHVEGVESVCGIRSNSEGVLEVKYPDGNLPSCDDEDDQCFGNFIFEVATAKKKKPSPITGQTKDCVRKDYVYHEQIYIAETDENYNPSPSTELFPDPGQEPTVPTIFGDIPTEAAEFASTVVQLAIGIAGGIAFLLMIFGAYRLIFSSGNPESVQQGKEVITAAIIGLIVIIFAVFILRLIGVSVLGLPV